MEERNLSLSLSLLTLSVSLNLSLSAPVFLYYIYISLSLSLSLSLVSLSLSCISTQGQHSCLRPHCSTGPIVGGRLRHLISKCDRTARAHTHRHPDKNKQEEDEAVRYTIKWGHNKWKETYNMLHLQTTKNVARVTARPCRGKKTASMIVRV